MACIKDKLVSELGSFVKREAHIVMILDDCGIHLDGRIRVLIEDAKAVIVYATRYCSDLLTITYMPPHYYSFCERHQVIFDLNWYRVHLATSATIPTIGVFIFSKEHLF